MSDEDFGLSLKERMTRAADDIVATPEMLGEVRERFVRRRHRQSWAMVIGVLIAVAAIVIPTTLTGGGTSTVSTHDNTGPAPYTEPAWARRCFERQEQIFGGVHLQPAPQYVGQTMGQAWKHTTAERPPRIGTVTAWNGKCLSWIDGPGTDGRMLFIAVVGDVNPNMNGAPNPDRIVAARVWNP